MTSTYTARHRHRRRFGFGPGSGGKIVIADRVDILLEIEAVYAGAADDTEESG